jgi:hypothetical protein
MPESFVLPQGDACRDPFSSADYLNPLLLQNIALRYAARDLNPNETASFETRLATDQVARDALSEAVRLSAAALGQSPPAPHSSFRAAIRERLLGWRPSWLARRAYRGHPLAWAGLGAATVAACVVLALSLAQSEQKNETPATTIATSVQPGKTTGIDAGTVAPEPREAASETTMIAPMPRDHGVALALDNGNDDHPGKPSVAEIWAELSTPDHVEKAHEEELRWRHKLREMGSIHPGRPTQTATITEPREP